MCLEDMFEEMDWAFCIAEHVYSMDSYGEAFMIGKDEIPRFWESAMYK